MFEKTIIDNNFSKHAKCYDHYCDVQSYCANLLLEQLPLKKYGKILEIGCGTGNYTKLLSEKFPESDITAIDISKKMIEAAKSKLKSEKIKFIAQDAEFIAIEDKFDLITSNATLHWFSDIKTALEQYKTMLNGNGVVSLSVFGPDTFCELKNVLEIFFKQEIAISSNYFINQNQIEKILKDIFKNTKVSENKRKQTYSSLIYFLQKIKNSGTRGKGLGMNNFWMPGTIEDLERLYLEKFGKIEVTYQIFFCEAHK